MARQLWFLRHGDAEPHGVRPDAERVLTDRGRAQAVAAGAAMAALGARFAVVFTSPKVRARDTAALAALPLGLGPVEHAPLAGGFSRADAIELIEAVGADERLLVVGHEPDFSQVVHDLTGARVDFKKGGLAGVRFEGTRGGELLVLLRPRELAGLAGGEPVSCPAWPGCAHRSCRAPAAGSAWTDSTSAPCAARSCCSTSGRRAA